jgi:NCS1 family nucleobase:cation symporter-1
MLRAFVACGWFGIQTWIGGLALSALLAAAIPAFTWVLLVAQPARPSRLVAGLIGGVQFLALAANAGARQWVQNMELAPYLDVAAEPVRTEWSPLVIFLVLFAAGLGVVVWMLRRIAEVHRREAAA